MNNPESVRKTIIAAVAVCLLLTTGLGVLAYQRSRLAEEALVELQQKQDRLDKLNKEIVETQNSIDRFKKEQEEFAELLFQERDVPAFLDGISDSAAKSLVYVLEMKTQRFTEVKVPKEIAESRKLPRARVYEDFEEQTKQSRTAQLSEMLTLAAMPINFKIRGTFEAIVNFLYSIEGYRQLLTVSNVSISADTVYPQLTCGFTLRIYSLKSLNDIKP